MTHLSTPKWNNSFLFLCLIAWLGILGLEITPAWSGGPLVVNNGTAVLWPTNQLPIVYTLDQGTLGSFNNSQAATLINTAFNTWNKVSTTQFRFNKNSKTLSEDVTVNNYLNYYTDSRDGSNPIIYDNDGSIINDLYGGNARNYVLGYTTVYYSGNYIVYTPVIMNGYFIKSQSQTLEEITSTVLHEIGHMCGLDHSQFAREVAYNDINTDDNCIPIMFPTSTGSSDTRNTLTLDDQISISALYPTTYFLNSTGTFSGTVKRSGKELPGVNVIARAITDPVNQVATTVTGT